ncbi:MAG TPA: FliH/SctL family protein [Bryobacteraceae bacterium]|jgi:flagellar assembly protein FliH|nr:FliH/SctL family protein [Bryobacteraceae bacterium]
MSSRIILPSDGREVGPLPWRQVGASGIVGAAPKPTEAPDHAAQIAQLEQQYQQKVRDAHAAGVREGEIAGRNRAAAEMQPVIERLTRSIQEIANLRARLRREAEADVVQLALAIARRVIRREIAADPDALRGLVVAALEKLQGQEISRVKVHPAHVAQVKAGLQQAVIGGAVEVLADASRDVGSVVFETARGNLDASVDSQLQEIERGLTDRLRKQS